MISRSSKKKTKKSRPSSRSKSKIDASQNEIQSEQNIIVIDTPTPLESEFIDDINKAAAAIEEQYEFTYLDD